MSNADTGIVADALTALLDPAPAGRAAIGWMLGWIFEGSSDPPGGFGGVAMIAASPATSAVHRTTLMQALRHATETIDVFPDRVRGYLADRSDRIHRFGELLDQHGPVPWRSQSVNELTAYTRLTRAEATLLLAGLPVRDWDEDDFLSDEQCAVLDLSLRDAQVGRMELLTVPFGHRIQLLDAAMPDDPAALWEQGPDVLRLAETWIALQGRRVPVREDLLAELGTVMGFPTGILRTFAEPSPGDWLHTDGECSSAGAWITTTAPSGGQPFSDRDLPSAAGGLAWLAYHLPAADPIRANLPRVYQLIRARLRNPKLLIGSVLLDQHEASAALSPALVAGQSLHTGKTFYHLRPAYITESDHPALDVIPDHSPVSIRLMLDPAFGRMISSLESVDLPAGAYAQNPLFSAPHLVERMAGRIGLDPAAASLYLQLLALPDPSDRNVCRWNGWDAVQLAQLGAALIHKGLVIDDEHPSAGRKLFVPGPWLVRKFVPAFEAWKAPLYGFTPNQDPPYRWTLVARPLAELFHAASDRVFANDLPR